MMVWLIIIAFAVLVPLSVMNAMDGANNTASSVPAIIGLAIFFVIGMIYRLGLVRSLIPMKYLLPAIGVIILIVVAYRIYRRMTQPDKE
ncbi:hypothetical protein BMS3Bbin04_00162 [bacterium BMS3Bbin04]|nr:hypothetical protein BMS3Bbin04_00162 [bacterium BMS3Bbin04]